MRLEADVTAVAIIQERLDLFFPGNTASSEGSPNRPSTFHMAVLGMYVDDAVLREPAVAAGHRILTSNERIRRIPDEFEVRMLNGVEDCSGFGSGADIAGVFVFQSDDEIVGSSLFS